MGYLDMWTVYYSPADYPGEWVVRPWRIDSRRDAPEPGRAILALSLDEARSVIPIQRHGLVRFPRADDDDAAIVETWG